MYKAIGRLSFALVATCGLLAIATLSACSQTTFSTSAGSVESASSVDAEGVPRTVTVSGAKNPTANKLEQKILSDGAVRMNGEEVTAYLAGNTQQWSNGGAYYDASGRIDYIWENKEFTDFRWRARKDGLVCIQNPEGFTTSCSSYYRYKNTVWTVVTEVFGEKRDFFGGPDTLLTGKKLSDLEPWDPSLSGN